MFLVKKQCLQPFLVGQNFLVCLRSGPRGLSRSPPFSQPDLKYQFLLTTFLGSRKILLVGFFPSGVMHSVLAQVLKEFIPRKPCFFISLLRLPDCFNSIKGPQGAGQTNCSCWEFLWSAQRCQGQAKAASQCTSEFPVWRSSRVKNRLLSDMQ